MTAITPAIPAQSYPDRWLAVLRIVVGLYFAKALVTKVTVTLLGGFLPVPAATDRWITMMPQLLTKYASENPLGWFKGFLENSVIPHGVLYAHLTAVGEACVGIGLTLGLLTGPSALVGLVLVINYGLATQWMSPAQQGFHFLLVTLMLAFIGARAGQTWGVDGWIARRYPGTILTRRPWS